MVLIHTTINQGGGKWRVKGKGKEQVSGVTIFLSPLLQTNTLLISFMFNEESAGVGEGKGGLT